MEIIKFKEFLTDKVIGGMVSYMDFFEDAEECPFTKEDVAKCEEILSHYLEALVALTNPSNEDIMACVQSTVLSLNQLSEDTDYSMIETDERENICELIQTSAVACGLQDPDEDITGEWREW